MSSQEPPKRTKPELAPGGQVGEPGRPEDAGDFSFERDDARLALDLLRDMADQEFARAERFGSRARNAFALAAGFFAVSQAVAFGSFSNDRVTSDEQTWLLALAAVAAVALAIAGWLVLEVERTRTVKNLEPDQVIEVLNSEGAQAGRVVDRFVELYAYFVKDMRRATDRRLEDATSARRAAALTMLVTLIELLYAFWIRH